MTFWTKRMLSVYHEFFRQIISSDIVNFGELRSRRRRLRGIKERISTFSTEEVQLVVIPLSKSRVVDRNEAGVHDRGLAVVAFRRKQLIQVRLVVE
jgi:hypothetical protein